MENLEELLEKEAENYRMCAAFIRHFVTHIRGLDKHFPIDDEVKMHIDACREYYQIYHTTEGNYSPWMSSWG